MVYRAGSRHTLPYCPMLSHRGHGARFMVFIPVQGVQYVAFLNFDIDTIRRTENKSRRLVPPPFWKYLLELNLLRILQIEARLILITVYNIVSFQKVL